ncbi:hypothetical protein HUG15_13510 [Salicibibacter cibarius]|uniref:Uncharacterized protein n=1 Tax=Salicibibacter cibarius TaxID=2743000 RepID=A0A7T6Z499_9BACI|nr:hypothetical protein [Salicibibacter cibarius]QQK76482.1 hypothetical protein HUG15_13510 [Salicibibacter cibarius]
MQKYRMSRGINQAIINGILQGYKNYIEERKAKREEMHISTAYSWVKGNHIDHQTAEECKEFGIGFKKAKAGYAWGYLQFDIDTGPSMFIIKNGKYFDEENFTRRKGMPRENTDPERETYLKRLSHINNNVAFPEEPSLFTTAQKKEYLTLFDDEQLEEPQARELEEKFNHFYIITYEIDEAFAISKIRMLMPNPQDNQAYEIEDLSEYIATSTVIFEEDDYEILIEDGFDAPQSPAAADYGIVHQEELFKDDEEEG